MAIFTHCMENQIQNGLIALQAALQGGAAIMEVYATDFSVETKEDHSPLTQADQKANEVIQALLLPTGIPIISEETKTLDYSTRQKWDRCWMVDPLDGTKEFVKRNGEFTVNIALIQDGAPIFGVVYAPVLGDVYFTKSEGAFKYTINPNVPVTAEHIWDHAQQMTKAPWEQPIKVVGSRSHMNADTEAYLAQLSEKHETEVVSKGSSLKFCLVAEGSAHVYPRFAPTMEWDTAAGHAVCTHAGLQVLNQETCQPLTYNKENLLNPYFLVCP